jgi:predicted NBD/HSP70 family sugar kinase
VKRAKRIDQVIAAISKEGPLPLAELVQLIPGIKAEDHLRKLVAKAEKAGILESGKADWDLPKALTAGKGNATHYVGVARDAGCVVGLNVGRTYFAIGVADANGRLLSTVRGPLPTGQNKKAEAARLKYRRAQIVTHKREEGVDGASLLRHIAEKACAWMKDVGVEPEQIRGVTVSLPAPVSTTESILLTESLEYGLGRVPHIASSIESELGEDFVNLQKVVVANDADVAARAEVRYGEAYGKKDVVVMHAAYGIGAGVLTEGSVLRNGAGGGVGEIGHCVPRIVRDEGARYGLVPLTLDNPLFKCSCQHDGHLEALAGGAAIVRRVRHSPDVDPKPPAKLAKLLEDPKASVADQLEGIIRSAAATKPWEPGREALLDAAHLIGGAIHTLTHILRPEAAYVSGKLSEAGEPFLTEVRKGFTECGPLSGYRPEIALGSAADQFGRRHVMVRGAAMTAVRATRSLIDVERIEVKLAAVKDGAETSDPDGDA